MYTIQSMGIVHRPLREVFDFVAVPTNSPIFTPNLTKITNVVPRDVCLGQEFDWRFSMAGIDLSGYASVTDFEDLRRVVFSATGDGVAEWAFEFDEYGKDTKLSIVITYDLADSVLSKFQNKFIIERINKRTAEQMLDNIKAILED